MNFLLRTPFLRLLLAVVAGIGVYNAVHVPAWAVWVAGGLSVALVAVSYGIRAVGLRYRYRWLFGCGAGLFFMQGPCIGTERSRSSPLGSAAGRAGRALFALFVHGDEHGCHPHKGVDGQRGHGQND